MKPLVLCGIDESGSPETVSAAIDSCRKHGADLRLVGVVKERFNDSTRGLAGERVRRHKQVKLALERAAKTARTAGVSVVTTIRGGDLARELARAAEAIGSGELFYVRMWDVSRPRLPTRRRACIPQGLHPWGQIAHSAAAPVLLALARGCCTDILTFRSAHVQRST